MRPNQHVAGPSHGVLGLEVLGFDPHGTVDAEDSRVKTTDLPIATPLLLIIGLGIAPRHAGSVVASSARVRASTDLVVGLATARSAAELTVKPPARRAVTIVLTKATRYLMDGNDAEAADVVAGSKVLVNVKITDSGKMEAERVTIIEGPKVSD